MFQKGPAQTRMGRRLEDSQGENKTTKKVHPNMIELYQQQSKK